MPCLEPMLGVVVLLGYSQWWRFEQATERAVSDDMLEIAGKSHQEIEFSELPALETKP